MGSGGRSCFESEFDSLWCQLNVVKPMRHLALTRDEIGGVISLFSTRGRVIDVSVESGLKESGGSSQI